MDNPDTFPTWGYQPDGAARIFDLAQGESLPEGWRASPDCITDPARATAEALTDRAAGRAYAEAGIINVLAVEPSRDMATAEIERLLGVIEVGTAENARLVGEIEEAEAELDAAAKLISDLQASLAKAQEDGGFAASERDAANASLEGLKGELAKVRADLESATAPKGADASKPAGRAR